jgi:putative FmdB family regulatory protein
MPLYEYQCESCSARFERIQKFTDPPPDSCPKCGGPVRKLLSSPAIQFKGSGFYITDYGRKGEAEATAKRAADKTSAESGGAKDASTKEAAPKDGTSSKETSGSADSGGSKESAAPKDSSGSKNASGSQGTAAPPPSPAKS